MTARGSFSMRGSRMYHQGWVHVKHRDVYRRLFGELRAGKDLRFYLDETRAMRTGGQSEFDVDLNGLKDIALKNDRRFSNQHPEYLIILQFGHGNPNGSEVKMRFGSVDERETWARYLRAVGLGKVPERTGHLLPGQIHEINDIINYEKQNYEYTAMSPQPPQQPWFYPKITDRHDAEEALKSTEQGNMLVRGRNQQNDDFDLAVSVMTATKEFKHYKMKKLSPSGDYFLSLSEAPNLRLQTLEDVMSYFEKRSNGKYKRCQQKMSTKPHIYEEHIPNPARLYQNERATAPSEYYNLDQRPPVRLRNGSADGFR